MSALTDSTLQHIVSSFVPQDRLAALAAGQTLPIRSRGAALFIDIAGFSSLADGLVTRLGPQRGAEDLTLILNRVFASLVDEVESHDGSVVAFAGDALMCWFEDDDGLRAVASSLAMQDAMKAFSLLPIPGGSADLSARAVVSAGSVARLLLGDPAVQVVEALAGPPITVLGPGNHVARPGEVVIDGGTYVGLQGRVEVGRWYNAEDGTNFATVSRLVVPVSRSTPRRHDTLDLAELRAWVPRAVFQRLSETEGDLLPEIRPAVALFLGIDAFRLYGEDGDVACEQLGAYVRHVQSVLTRYGGILVDVTTGDKGTYLFGAFGAPLAHGDDLLRAASAAEELKNPPPDASKASVRIGLAAGPVYAGIFGASSRRCYGIRGGAVNVAARLMEHAAPHKALLSGGFGASTVRRFEIRPLPPQFLKGHAAPVPTSELVGPREDPAVRLAEPQYTVPMVDRREARRRALARIRQAAGGAGQVVGVSGDAGIGKSRFLAEVIQLASAAGFEVLVGAGESFGTSIPYLAWRRPLRRIFRLAPGASHDEQVAQLRQFLAEIDYSLPPLLPLLAPLLGLSVPDNEVTGPIPVPVRKRMVHDILLRCLGEMAARRPLLLVAEDCHWLDSLSMELLHEVMAHAGDHALLLVAAYRPPEEGDPPVLGTERGESYTELQLEALDEENSAELIELKLGELFGLAGDVPEELVERITQRAQGNPFYTEEILNHLNDLGLDPNDVQTLDQIGLPTSVHSLILDRLDRLPPGQQHTLRVAAVIGRRFWLDWLWGVDPELGEERGVRASLDALARLDLVAQDLLAPEPAYLFKHITTWEAVYQSLPFSARAAWHEQLAAYLERELAPSPPVELLAYHYGRSDNRLKELAYVVPAGEAAVARGAYREATQYFERGLVICTELPDSPERASHELALQLGIGGVLVTVKGQGSPEAKTCYDRAMELIEAVAPGPELVRALFGLWTYYLFRGDMRPTDELAQQILAVAEGSGNPEALLQAHFAVSATVYWLGDFAGTVEHADEVYRLYDPQQAALYVARYAQNPRITAAADASWSEWIMGHAGAALRRSEETVAHARELGHEFVVTIALQVPALLSLHMGDVTATAAAAEEWLEHANRVGNPVYIGMATACLGWVRAASGAAMEGLGMLQGVRQGFLDAGVEILNPLLATAQADACLRCGEAESGLQLLEATIPHAVAKGQVAYLTEQHRLRGELALLAGRDEAEAEGEFREALALAQSQGARAFSLRAALSLGRLLQTSSRSAEALDLLRSIRASITEGEDTPDVQAADRILATGAPSVQEG